MNVCMEVGITRGMVMGVIGLVYVAGRQADR